jgi:UDP-N-acetylglucosamine 2-epimerase (non-hydrolysing)
VTAHRATNVDNPDRLRQLVRLVHDLAEAIGPVTFPVHPRTRRALERAGQWQELAAEEVILTDPVPYTIMIDLVAGSKLVVTDSGGLQEEPAWLGVPVVVLHRSTPRWEGLRTRIAILTGLDADRALTAAIELTCPQTQHRIRPRRHHRPRSGQHRGLGVARSGVSGRIPRCLPGSAHPVPGRR